MRVTVIEVIRRSAEFLGKKGVESPRLQVELLLGHVLQLPRMKLYLNFERELTPEEQDDVRELVKRRGQREPLQHIVGSTSFCGLELAVNRNVLVPRPETEMLAELGWQFLNALAGSPSIKVEGKDTPHPCPLPGERENRIPSRNILATAKLDGQKDAPIAPPLALDFGMGSGCLAIALAVKSPGAQVWAVDFCPEALTVAQQNASRHQMESRIQFLEGDGFAVLPPEMRFDLIVGNPPYIPSAEIETLEPEVRDHDPRLALDGGTDGLDFYRRLAGEAGGFLKPGGRIMLEFGDGQEGAIQNLFEQQKWIVEAVKADYSGRPRILIAHRGG